MGSQKSLSGHFHLLGFHKVAAIKRLHVIETAAILVHNLNRFSLCTKMAAVAVAKLSVAML